MAHVINYQSTSFYDLLLSKINPASIVTLLDRFEKKSLQCENESNLEVQKLFLEFFLIYLVEGNLHRLDFERDIEQVASIWSANFSKLSSKLTRIKTITFEEIKAVEKLFRRISHSSIPFSFTFLQDYLLDLIYTAKQTEDVYKPLEQYHKYDALMISSVPVNNFRSFIDMEENIEKDWA